MAVIFIRTTFVRPTKPEISWNVTPHIYKEKSLNVLNVPMPMSALMMTQM